MEDGGQGVHSNQTMRREFPVALQSTVISLDGGERDAFSHRQARWCISLVRGVCGY